jgi:ubiquinone/menaquinone biosynthesis C-methylase UbiE
MEKLVQQNIDTEEIMRKKDPIDTSPQFMERDKYDYEYFLGVSSGELSGKKVLNIGAGNTGMYEKDIAKEGAEVITMSPYLGVDHPGGEYMREQYTEGTFAKAKRTLFKEGNFPSALAGWAEALPIADETIDEILALYSVPLYSEKHEYATIFQEAFRVLRESGTARFYPVSKEVLDNIFPILEKMPIDLKYEQIEELPTDRVFRNEVPYRLTLSKKTRL